MESDTQREGEERKEPSSCDLGTRGYGDSWKKTLSPCTLISQWKARSKLLRFACNSLFLNQYLAIGLDGLGQADPNHVNFPMVINFSFNFVIQQFMFTV